MTIASYDTIGFIDKELAQQGLAMDKLLCADRGGWTLQPTLGGRIWPTPAGFLMFLKIVISISLKSIF